MILDSRLRGNDEKDENNEKKENDNDEEDNKKENDNYLENGNLVAGTPKIFKVLLQCWMMNSFNFNY